MKEIFVAGNEKKELIMVHAAPENCEHVIRLSGERAEVHIDEIFISGGIKSSITVIHDAPNTISRVRTRGVVGKNQEVIANAKVIIPKRSHFSDSFVAQHFLLFDETSRVDALPSLEIEADEVKASHAATISPVDPEKIFYLVTRGISKQEATKLIIEGFLKLPKDSEYLLEKWCP